MDHDSLRPEDDRTDALLGLGSWPGVGADYRIAKTTPTPPGSATSSGVTVCFTFDTSRYTPDSGPATSSDASLIPGWRQRALADEVVLRARARQLAAPGVVMNLTTTMDAGVAHSLSVSSFTAFASEAAAYLAAIAAGSAATPVPVPPTVDVAIEASNPEDIFALTVAVDIARPAAHADDDVPGGGVEHVSTPVAPHQALAEFARDLENACLDDQVFLKVMTARSRCDTSEDANIWIVRYRRSPGAAGSPGIGFQVDGPARYYAPCPLANALVSCSNAPIVHFDPKAGIDWQNPETIAFTDIAMDIWGRTALAGLDRFLTPDFVGATFLIDHVDPDRNAF